MKLSSTVACPHCKKEILWDDTHPYRPFCSQRCQLIDLGDWIEEKYVIAEETPEALDDDSSAIYGTDHHTE